MKRYSRPREHAPTESSLHPRVKLQTCTRAWDLGLGTIGAPSTSTYLLKVPPPKEKPPPKLKAAGENIAAAALVVVVVVVVVLCRLPLAVLKAARATQGSEFGVQGDRSRLFSILRHPSSTEIQASSWWALSWRRKGKLHPQGRSV